MRASTKTMWYSGLIIVLILLGVSMASAALSDYNSNQVAYWGLDESGTTIVDLTPNGYDLVRTGGSQNSTAILNFSQTLYKSSKNQLNRTHTPALDLANTNYTVSYWINPMSWSGGVDRIMGDDNTTTAAGGGWGFYYQGQIRWIHKFGGATNNWASGVTISTSTWTHIVHVYDGSYRRIYKNGVEVANISTTTNTPGNTNAFCINNQGGSTCSDISQQSNSLYDEVAIWNTSLNYDDIAELYASGSPTTSQRYPYGSAVTNYFTITATDSYTGAAINGFTALVNGTYYSNSTGNTIYTNINTSASTPVVNITINSSNYFNKTYTNHNTISDLSGTMHSSEITFYAYNRVSGIALFTPITNTCTNCTNINNAADGNYNTFSSPNTNTSSYYYQNFTNANTLTVKAHDKYGSGGAVSNATIQAYNYSSSAWEDFIESNGTAISKAVPANYVSSSYLQIRTNISSYAAGTLCVGSCVNGRFFEASAGTLTATATNNTATAARPTLNLSVGTYTINFNANNYYPTSTSITTNSLEQSTTNISMYDHKLNVTINVLNGSVTEQNFTADVYSLDYSYHEQITTTNGETIFNLTPGEYTVYINDSIHHLVAQNVTLNSSSNLTSLTIDLYSTNSIDFRFIDVDTDELVDDRNVTVFITGTIQSYSFTTDNGSYFAELINPDTYTITYSADGYFQGERFFTLTNRTTNILNLYLINSSESEIIATVVNDLTATVPSEIIILQKKNLSGTNYYAVDSCITSPAGSCILHANIGETTYRAVLTSSSGVVHRTTNDFKFTGTTITFRVNLASNPLSFVDDIDSISSSLTQSNTSTNIIYSFTWNDASGISSFACVDVVYRVYASTNNISTCNSASSGSFTVNESFGVAQSVCGNSYFIIDGVRFSDKTECFEILNQGVSDFGEGGLFLYITFFIGTLILSFVLVPQAPIVIPIVAGLMIVFGGWLGIIGLTSVAIGGFLVLCVLVVVVVSQK